MKTWLTQNIEHSQEIHKLTKPYRIIANQIEQYNELDFIDKRFQTFYQEKERMLAQKVDELDALLALRQEAAASLWRLKDTVVPNQRYDIRELVNILPVSSAAKGVDSLVKYYKKVGLEIISESRGVRKHRHYVTGGSIINLVNGLVSCRGSHVTLGEFLTLINPGGSDKTRVSKDKLVKSYTVRLNGRPIYLTFANNGSSKDGSSIVAISRKNAIKILKAYVLGGYEHRRLLPLKDLESILPELFNQKSASKSHVKQLCESTQVNFYTKHSGGREFSKSRGYLADISKVKNYFLAEYERMNLDIEKELLDASINEYEEGGVEISSSSFNIKQKPSEYLFLRAGMRGGHYYDCLPQILGYFAVNYFFMGNDRQSGAFERYEVNVDGHIAESWQSHKGRHWQTTSLFRAGLAEMVVNKWMGRTTGQGERYDHNTGRERAKVVGETMLKDTERFLGDVPQKIQAWKRQEIPTNATPEYLSETLQSIQYSPLGYCTRALYLKPCEFNLKCLTGNNGKGCKHYIYDLQDPSHREKVIAERDRSSLELSRLFEVYENGVEAAKMHIEHHMTIVRNTTSILDNAEMILDDEQLEDLQDYMPFKKEGSYPEDCPFQCGGDE